MNERLLTLLYYCCFQLSGQELPVFVVKIKSNLGKSVGKLVLKRLTY